MNLLELATRRFSASSQQPENRSISSIGELFEFYQQFQFNGANYPIVNQTYSKLEGQTTEDIGPNFNAYAENLYKTNGILFTAMLVRMLVFSEGSFQYQERRNGRPTRLFGHTSLLPLEKPWPSGTTANLLSRMIQDVDLAGNFYAVHHEGETIRLNPGNVFIILGPRMIDGKIVGYKKLGYLYYEGGPFSGNDPKFFNYDEVAHYAPIPDPTASWKGMSWITPIVREIIADSATTSHKSKFFENGATPNMVVRIDPEFVSNIAELKEFYDELEDSYGGVRNAYKTMFLAGAADVEVVGNSFEQISFKTTQGAGETRIAAAAGVAPVIAGFSEGLQAATYSNYAQARRRFVDGTIVPLWRDAAGALDTIIQKPVTIQRDNIRLWYDTRDIPFLREDAMAAADILRAEGTLIRTLTDAGFVPDNVVEAVTNGDLAGIKHTGLYSVQLQLPLPKQQTELPESTSPSNNNNSNNNSETDNQGE